MALCRIQPATRFYMALELRIVFMFLSDRKKKTQKRVISDVKIHEVAISASVSGFIGTQPHSHLYGLWLLLHCYQLS